MKLRAALALLLASGCANQWVRTHSYTARVGATQDEAAELKVAVARDLAYSESLIVSEQGSDVRLRKEQSFTPLVLTISNPTSGIVTIDWDHSVFVDSTGTSHKLLYPGSGTLPPGVEAIKKPPTPVVAPGARLVVSVMPEPPGLWHESRGFFLPRGTEPARLRVVLATSGSAHSHSEVVVVVEPTGAKESRGGQSRWPGHGEACVPVADWCEVGCSCQSGRCVDPRKAPLPVGTKRAGESCRELAECRPGLNCSPMYGVCVAP